MADHDQSAPIRVAVAEDEADVRQALERLLQHLGYEVGCSVSNGAELLGRCECERFDVVLLDLDMPVLDGLATAEEVAERGTPVVLVSGHPDVSEVVVGQEPIATILKKPVLAESLRRAVETAIAGRSGL